MPLSFEEEIALHAAQEAPLECCGLVIRRANGDVLARRTPNIAIHPEIPAEEWRKGHFEISFADYVAAQKEGEVVGYYHSHVDEGTAPSDIDRHVATEARLPLYIHSVRDNVLDVYLPDGYRQPLEGRRFLPMVFDCVSLVWDYMRQQRGVELPLLPRTRRAYFHGVDFDWSPWLQQFNADVVTGAPQEGDILVMMTNHATKPNHLGVYLGDGHFLHQPGDVPSKREVWAGDWQRATAYFIRIPAAPGSPAAQTV